MVITSKDDIPLDGPPSYDSLSSPPHPSARPTGDQKRPFPPYPSSSSSGPSRLLLPNASASGSASRASPSAWGLLSGEYWKRRAEEEEIRRTVRALLKDVIHNLSDPSSLDVLHSSYIACAGHGISFPLLSQEPIEAHPPIYWAILTLAPLAKSLPGGNLGSQPPEEGWPALDLLSSFTLSEATQREATAACVLGDDNALFQYLRQTEGFAPQGLAESITARSLSSSTSNPGGSALGEGRREADLVQVEHVADLKAGHFRVRFRVRDWLRRIRMHKKVGVSWVARGRAWNLSFGIANGHPYSSGTWYCSISLINNTGSTAAPLSALIELGRPSYRSPELMDLEPPTRSSSEEGERKTVTLKIQKGSLEPHDTTGAYVKFADTPGAASLEYEDSPFIESDGSVWVEGDFVLEKQ